MKNRIKFFGIIILVALIGFSMTACDNGSTKDQDRLTLTVNATTGSLVVSGLDSHDGKWILAEAKSQNLFCAGDATSNGITGALISSGLATLKVWTITGSEENATFGNYNGNDTVNFAFGILAKATISINEFATVMIDEGAVDWLIAEGTAVGVTFTGGSASATYSP